MDDRPTTLSWPDAIYAQFRRVGIRQVGYVPDAGHSRLIELCVKDPDIHDVVLTTEEEGVALAAGATLGGGVQLAGQQFARARPAGGDCGVSAHTHALASFGGSRV